MDQQQGYFVGYATLEALLVTHERASALYMALVEEGRPTSNPGVVSRRTYIVASDIQQGVVRYWRYRLGSWIEVGGQPLDPVVAAQLRARGKRVDTVLRRVIGADFGLTTEAAIMSFPKALAMVDGVTGLLRVRAYN